MGPDLVTALLVSHVAEAFRIQQAVFLESPLLITAGLFPARGTRVAPLHCELHVSLIECGVQPGGSSYCVVPSFCELGPTGKMVEVVAG